MEPFKFTKSKLLDLPPAPKGKQIEYRDSHVRGLRLRVGATGTKTFCAVRKVRGKFIRAVLGRFPELSVERARTLALEKLGDIGVTGRNPNEVKREQESAKVTLEDALELYVATRGHRLKDATARQYRRMLSNFSGDWLKRPLSNISRDDVLNRHKAITDGVVWFGSDLSTLRSGVASGSKSQADLWGRYLRAVYNFSYDNYRDKDGVKLLPEPPTIVLSTKRQWHGVIRKSTRIRNHELGRWLRSVAEVRNQAEHNRDDHVAAICDALDMALFTGLRRAEVFGLEWDRVNLGGGYFWIDKTKNGVPLELPITKTLSEIFKRRWNNKIDGVAYVFPSAMGLMVSDPRKVIDAISVTTTLYTEDKKPITFTCHDARRTFATIAELSGVGNYILKRLMNHKSGRSSDVTQGYINLSAEELMEPAKVIEEKILFEAGFLTEEKRSVDNFVLSLSESERQYLISSLIKNG